MSLAVAWELAWRSMLKPEFCAALQRLPARKRTATAAVEMGERNRLVTKRLSFTRTERDTTLSKGKFPLGGVAAEPGMAWIDGYLSVQLDVQEDGVKAGT